MALLLVARDDPMSRSSEPLAVDYSTPICVIPSDPSRAILNSIATPRDLATFNQGAVLMLSRVANANVALAKHILRVFAKWKRRLMKSSRSGKGCVVTAVSMACLFPGLHRRYSSAAILGPAAEPTSRTAALMDIDILSHVLTTSSSAPLLRKAAIAFKDFNKAARRVRRLVLARILQRSHSIVERVIQQTMELNPGTQRADRPSFVEDPNHDQFGNVLDWHMSDLELEQLPESLAELAICGELDLSMNNLQSIPDNFGSLVVGSLNLGSNSIEYIPHTFSGISVSGDLTLSDNDLMHKESLPETFGGLTVGGSLFMAWSRTICLPVSFGKITVGGDLVMTGNILTTLPHSFGQIKVGGKIDLQQNELQEIPESFKQLVVHGSLNLGSNAIVDWPDSFLQIQVGEDLDLGCNHLGDYATRKLSTMLVGGRILFNNQTNPPDSSQQLVRAEFNAALATLPATLLDTCWMDPITGNFVTDAHLPDVEGEGCLTPNEFPEDVMDMISCVSCRPFIHQQVAQCFASQSSTRTTRR